MLGILHLAPLFTNFWVHLCSVINLDKLNWLKWYLRNQLSDLEINITLMILVRKYRVPKQIIGSLLDAGKLNTIRWLLSQSFIRNALNTHRTVRTWNNSDSIKIETKIKLLATSFPTTRKISYFNHFEKIMKVSEMSKNHVVKKIPK